MKPDKTALQELREWIDGLENSFFKKRARHLINAAFAEGLSDGEIKEILKKEGINPALDTPVYNLMYRVFRLVNEQLQKKQI